MCSRSRRTRSMTRRSGPKTRRRPKYLSLRRQLNRPDLPAMPAPEISDHHDRDPNLTCLLDDHDGGGAALAALLGSGDVLAGNHDTLSSPSPASSSMNDEDELARRALRGRERLMFCSSTASSSSLDEVNVSACKVFDLMRDSPSKTLSLKLDYDEILTAWSDRGSLYMEGEASQVVPEIYDGTVFVEMGSNGNAWRVPEVKVENGEEVKVDQGKGVVESREARVMRYKEKRRRRLFAKRIRYEVRKLNAEKRPRMKGRFVKRQDDE